MKNKLLAICIGLASASAMASWTPGDFNGEFNINGTITRDSLAQLWEWKVGSGLNFDSAWNDLNEDKTTLSLNVTKAEGILYGRTKQAIDTGGNTGAGVLPQIAFSDYANRPVSLIQDSTDSDGKGHIKLPIKNANGDSEIGTLKVNVTAIGMAVGPDNGGYGGPNNPHNVSMTATSQQHALYGGLFPRSIYNALRNANDIVARFQGTTLNDLLRQVGNHPSYTLSGKWINGLNTPVDFTPATAPFDKGVASVSYVLGIDQNQTLDATFNSPISSTTEWSAPLKVAVTYQ